MPPLSLPTTAVLLLAQSALFSCASVCGPKPDYGSVSTSRQIPYADLPNSNLAYDFALEFTVSTSLSVGEFTIQASMDTGSTGIAIGATLINLKPEDLEGHPKGYEALSGGTFWQGFWVPADKVNITFPSAGVTAQVPILVVTSRSTCHASVVDGVCQGKETDVQEMPAVKYLG